MFPAAQRQIVVARVIQKTGQLRNGPQRPELPRRGRLVRMSGRCRVILIINERFVLISQKPLSAVPNRLNSIAIARTSAQKNQSKKKKKDFFHFYQRAKITPELSRATK